MSSTSSADQKLTSSERISFGTRHDNFSARSRRAVSTQVALFLRDCKRQIGKLSSSSRSKGKRVSLRSSDSS